MLAEVAERAELDERRRLEVERRAEGYADQIDPVLNLTGPPSDPEPTPEALRPFLTSAEIRGPLQAHFRPTSHRKSSSISDHSLFGSASAAGSIADSLPCSRLTRQRSSADDPCGAFT